METATYQNVQEIARIEREALLRRSRAERLGDLIATHAGRIWFIVLHIVWFLLWIALNAGWGSQALGFDPFPFSLLTMIVSLESIFLSLFILMSQNRSARQADQRSHLDLQINLLSERENTKMLKMLQALCSYHGLAAGVDPEIEDLAARTKPQEVLQELAKNVPTSENIGAPGK
ncbi:MAG TPA: DUF1003 domain-containing protein [Terriglobales bacterium]|jgi:uncharacterized membrane protein|nr:DUF1003 domain-containing protein [Terriglobales bacterium]